MSVGSPVNQLGVAPAANSEAIMDELEACQYVLDWGSRETDNIRSLRVCDGKLEERAWKGSLENHESRAAGEENS